MNEQDHNPQEILWDLIRATRFCMLAHRHPDGSLQSHPLTTVNRELGPDRCLYFFVSRSSELGQHLQADGNVNLAYANPDKDSYVSISGSARVLDDLQRKRELFNPMVKAWFPDGPQDPDAALLQVHIDGAEYWDVRESKLVQLFKMAKAAMTGERPDHRGEHGTV